MVERKCARIAQSAVCLLVVVAALAAPGQAFARDADRSRTAQEVWDAYPLQSATERATAPAGADAGSAAPAAEMAASPSDDVERLALASVLALIAGGITTWLVAMRWPQAQLATTAQAALAPAPAPAPAPDPAPARSSTPELWLHATDAPPAEPPVRPVLASPPPASGSPGPPSPPEPDRAWAAEIEWQLVDGASQFRVAARPVDGADDAIALGESPLLEWPPSGPLSVQALTDGVRALESALVAAGWTPLQRGSAWYAKRFTWQPGARPPAAPAAVRTRHLKLYEAEYAQQVHRTQRLRRTVTSRLIAQGGGEEPAGMTPD
jgi:hypothetical protein